MSITYYVGLRIGVVLMMVMCAVVNVVGDCVCEPLPEGAVAINSPTECCLYHVTRRPTDCSTVRCFVAPNCDLHPTPNDCCNSNCPRTQTICNMMCVIPPSNCVIDPSPNDCCRQKCKGKQLNCEAVTCSPAPSTNCVSHPPAAGRCCPTYTCPRADCSQYDCCNCPTDLGCQSCGTSCVAYDKNLMCPMIACTCNVQKVSPLITDGTINWVDTKRVDAAPTLSTGAIVGIAVGGGVLLLSVIAGVVVIVHLKRKKAALEGRFY